MTSLYLIVILSIYVCYGEDAQQQTYPVGDIRNCPTTQLQDTNSTLLRMSPLPGLGFDNLRNLDVGRIYNLNYSTCQISSNGLYILPNDIYLIPVLNSEVDYSAEVFDHFNDWKSTTSTSINVEGSYGSVFSKINAKFSTDYQSTKSKMVNSNSRSVRVGLRHHLYSVHVNPDAQLHPSFKSRILDIAGNIQNNNTELAHYLSDLLIRDYGTHVVTSIEAGASLYQTTFVSQEFMKESESSQLTISTSASASFFSSFSISTNFKFSKSHVDSDGFSSSTTHSHTTTNGGPPFKLSNFSYTDWENGILNNLVAINRRGQPIYSAISSVNVPELPNVLFLETIQYIYKSVGKYYKINTHYGCTDYTSANFNFQANIDDNSCKMNQQNHTFGGVYQTCNNSQDHDVCGDYSASQTNPLTSGYSCPSGYHAILLHTGTLTKTVSVSNCKKKCTLGIFCHTSCYQSTVINYATYHAYWCAFPPGQTVPSDSGFTFGGIYTSREQNPITGARSCPMFFYPLHFGEDIKVCVSNDIEASSYSIPFGGFDSCTNGNPLAASSKQFQQGVYPHQCPCHYNQFLVTVDQGCIINYCSSVEAFKKQSPHPPRLPPYKVKAALTVNMSNTLVIKGPYGSVWVKGENGEWSQYTNGQYNDGVEYVESLESENVNPITGKKESRSATYGQFAGVVIGTFIGTILCVVFIAIIGWRVSKCRKHRRIKLLSQPYLDIENSFERSEPLPNVEKNDNIIRELSERIKK